MKISVLGSGAFGTALAISLSTGENSITLWGRNPKQVTAFSQDRENKDRLPNCPFPTSLCVTPDLELACDADAILIAVPTQSLRKFAEENHTYLRGKTLIACCKGFDMETGKGPVDMLKNASDQAAILTGPSFANDIARGLPTALTLACEQAELGIALLQDQLTSKNIRLYRTQDVIGAELGGGLKNVIAIGCGAAIGAGLGESARAALMTRGFAEMRRFAAALGGRDTTLCGLSGFGDLSLTCMSEQSRNFRYGLQLGQGRYFKENTTVEGKFTAQAALTKADKLGLDVPIIRSVSDLVTGKKDVETLLAALLARPQKEE